MSRLSSTCAKHRFAPYVAALCVALLAAVLLVAPRAEAGSAPAASPAAALPVGSVAFLTTPRASAPAASRLPVNALKVVNWYPASNSWANTWTNYNHAVTDSDFAAIRGLNANTVRVIVQPSAVGFPTINAKGASSLRDVFSTAATYGLQVQLTLFDLFGLYDKVSQSQQWIAQLAALVPDQSRVPLIELQNEMNPANAAAMAWAKALLPTLSQYFPGVPRTVSVTGSSRIAGLTALNQQLGTGLDVVDVHLYDDWSHAVQTLKAAVGLAAGRPVIIGEAGVSTLPGVAATEQWQANLFLIMGSMAARMQLPPPAPWTLNDFVRAGVGGVSNPSASELTFGLRRTDGSPKPAYAAVARMFANYQPAAPAFDEADYDGSLENEQNTAYNGTLLGAWKVANTDLAKGIGTTTAAARTGVRSAYLTGTPNNSTRSAAVCQMFPVVSSGSVQVSVYALTVQSSPSSGTLVALAWFDGVGNYLGQNVSPIAAPGRSDWQQLSVTATPPANAEAVQVALKSNNNAGTVYFDDVVLTGVVS